MLSTSFQSGHIHDGHKEEEVVIHIDLNSIRGSILACLAAGQGLDQVLSVQFDLSHF